MFKGEIRKYKVNDNYFDNIDTEEKAYFLGFLFAGGNISNNTNSITIRSHKRNKELISYLSKIIFYEKETLYLSKNISTLRFSSAQIKQNLIKLGRRPDRTIIFPNIDINLQRHFIRGFFDCKSSVSSSKINDHIFNVNLNKSFCESVCQIIFEQVKLDGKTCSNNDNDILLLIYAGNRKVQKLMDWLYNDATIYLQPKYEKYQKLVKINEATDNRIKQKYENIINRTEKVCSSCTQTKPLSVFSKNKYSVDEHYHICNECLAKIRNTEKYKENRLQKSRKNRKK